MNSLYLNFIEENELRIFNNVLLFYLYDKSIYRLWKYCWSLGHAWYKMSL